MTHIHGSLVTLCTLATCAAQNYTNSSQAQEIPNFSEVNTSESSIISSEPKDWQENLEPELPSPSFSPDISVRERLTRSLQSSSTLERGPLNQVPNTYSEYPEATHLDITYPVVIHPDVTNQVLFSQSSIALDQALIDTSTEVLSVQVPEQGSEQARILQRSLSLPEPLSCPDEQDDNPWMGVELSSSQVSILSELMQVVSEQRQQRQAFAKPECDFADDPESASAAAISEENITLDHAVTTDTIATHITNNATYAMDEVAHLETDNSSSEYGSEQVVMPSPLEQPPTRLFNTETANHLSAGAVHLSIGSHQTLPDSAPGTGHQLYYGGLEWGVSDNLQLSVSGQVYDDPPTQTFYPTSDHLNNYPNIDALSTISVDSIDQLNAFSASPAASLQSPNITLSSVAAGLKLQLIDTERFAASVQGSVELLPIASKLLHLNNELAEELIGSVHLPMTYTVSPDLQIHVTPGVSFFPDSINDLEFFDTVFTVGTGISWQPSERWSAYGTLNVPLGPGGNTINRDLSIDRQLVWTVGTRYNVTPQVGVELYATNGLGVTPATGILTSIPEGNELLLGARLNYTPDTGMGYRSSFRDTPLVPRSNRDHQLAINGLTLATANTLEPGHISLTGGIGTDHNYHAELAYSPSEHLQFEAILEDFSDHASVNPVDTAGDGSRYMLGAKLQLLNQLQGAPVSVSARVLGGRDADNENTIGVLFAELPITYQIGSSTALFLNPKIAAFGEETYVGVGVGINQKIAGGLQLIGEVTSVFNDGSVGSPLWAAGARYSLPRSALNLDVYATNAVGRHGLGTLVQQSDTRFGVGLTWILGQ